jgi:hypothetical protein
MRSRVAPTGRNPSILASCAELPDLPSSDPKELDIHVTLVGKQGRTEKLVSQGYPTVVRAFFLRRLALEAF